MTQEERLVRCPSNEWGRRVGRDEQPLMPTSAATLTARFDDHHWLEGDQDHEFPREFHDVIAAGGWVGMTIPEKYGGHRLGTTEATVDREGVSRSGDAMDAAGAIHPSCRRMQPVAVQRGSPRKPTA